MLDPAECRHGHGVVVLNAARHLGVRTSQTVTASTGDLAWPDIPGNKTPRAIQAPKATAHGGKSGFLLSCRKRGGLLQDSIIQHLPLGPWHSSQMFQRGMGC